MFYVKDKDGNPIYLPDAPVFSSCPVCGAEHNFDEFWELLTENADFDPFSSAWCESCSKVHARLVEMGWASTEQNFDRVRDETELDDPDEE